MRRRFVVASLLALLIVPAPALADESGDGAGAGAGDGAGDEGESAKLFEITDERVVESSGLTASSVHDGIFYTHNDSGHDAFVYAIDEEGSVVAELELGEVEPEDWESIARGPDERIWIGDIGDNEAEREYITLYRFREPEPVEDQGVYWSRFRFEYEDGPHDAESLLIHPETAQVFVVTKTPGGGAIYAGPEEVADDSTNVLTKVADAPSLVTDGEFLPDGSGIVLRTYLKAYVIDYPSWEPRGELPTPLQRQSESVTVTGDGERILIGSEGRSSAVYEVPMTALAEEVEPATPTPKSTGSAEQDDSAGEERAGEPPDGEGLAERLESALGGIPLWIPAAALGIALAAGAASFPNARRPRAPVKSSPEKASGGADQSR